MEMKCFYFGVITSTAGPEGTAAEEQKVAYVMASDIKNAIAKVKKEGYELDVTVDIDIIADVKGILATSEGKEVQVNHITKMDGCKFLYPVSEVKDIEVACNESDVIATGMWTEKAILY